MDDETKILNNVDPPQEVVYVKERPFVKLVVGSFVVIFGIVFFLWSIGFVMALTNHRPPTFDKQIVQDQWDKTVKDPATSYDDCVDKGGSIQEKFPPSCSFAGDTFEQSIQDACAAAPDYEQCVNPEGETGAKKAGAFLGEKYTDAKKAGKEFVEGFAEESTLDESVSKFIADANEALTPKE